MQCYIGDLERDSTVEKYPCASGFKFACVPRQGPVCKCMRLNPKPQTLNRLGFRVGFEGYSSGCNFKISAGALSNPGCKTAGLGDEVL